MKKLNENDPAPYNGILLTEEEFYKYRNYKQILKWVYKKLENTV